MRIKPVYLILIVIVYLIIQFSSFFLTQEPPPYITLSADLEPLTLLQHQQLVTKQFIKHFLSSDDTSNTSSCVFPNPQYSDLELDEIFKYKVHGACKTVTNATISIVDDVVQGICDNGLKPLFSHDPSSVQTLGGSSKDRPNWTKSQKMDKNGEFVIVRCGSRSMYTIFINRFKQEVSEKANSIRAYYKGDKKPFNVIILLFDQVSKYSPYRNWPEVMNFFREMKTNTTLNDSFSLYEFEKPTSVRPKTLDNMVQVLYGMELKNARSVLGLKRLGKYEKSESHLQLQRQNSLWNYYSSLGYTTMFLKDTVHDFLCELTGRHILTDHVFVNFWRTAWSVYKWNDFAQGQRCLGDKNSHAMSMEYLLQYLDNYKDNNKFAYVHLGAAHERSGNVRTVDKDLVEFLQRFLGIMKEREENFVFLLMGDHGIKRLPRIQWDIRNFYESNVPMTYFLMSKEVEKRWNLGDLMVHNTKQLLGRLDINLSLKDIAYFPYHKLKKTNYKKLKSSYSVTNVASIFTEKLSPHRNCGDLGVKDHYCLCSGLKEIDLYEMVENNIILTIIELTDQYFEIKRKQDPSCQKLENFILGQRKYFFLTGPREGYSLLFYLELEMESGAKIEIISRFCFQAQIEWTGQILPREIYPYKYFTVNNVRCFSQISSVEIVNSTCSEECLC